INTAIHSACSQSLDHTHLITSAVEHSATLKLADHLAKRGFEITRLPVDSLGQLDLAKLEKALHSDTALVSLLWANNETGVLFPIQQIAEICRAKRVPLHSDAVQAVGKIPVNVAELGVSMLSLSGHKLHAPKGVGALFVSKRLRYNPLLRGSQESARRGGTENVASIVALGKAAEIALDHIAEEQTLVRRFRDEFEQAVLARIPGASVNGDPANRLPNTSNLSFEGIESEGALILLDERGICCSAGSACTAGSVHPSHVLKGMGMSNERARASLRFSFGRLNRAGEVPQAIHAVVEVVAKLRSLNAGGSVAMAV
ncbi:MAG TPA: aminotransferase class V-fold PLP-dependent enzyme, partial [Chthoniobacterales bacterium]